MNFNKSYLSRDFKILDCNVNCKLKFTRFIWLKDDYDCIIII